MVVFCAVPTRRRNQDAGKSVSEETLLASARIWLQNQIPMAFQGADEMVGARREAGRFLWLIFFGCFRGYFGAEQAAALQHEVLREYWGPNSSTLMAAHSLYSFERHFVLMRSFVIRHDGFLTAPVHQQQTEYARVLAFCYALPVYSFVRFRALIRFCGDVRNAVSLFNGQHSALHSYLDEVPPPGAEIPIAFMNSAPAMASPETDVLHDGFRPALLKLLAACGCRSTDDVVRWYEHDPAWSFARARTASSKDGLHHYWVSE